MSLDTFGTRESLNHNGENFEIFNIQRIAGSGDLPFSLKILLENLVRSEEHTSEPPVTDVSRMPSSA